MIALQGLLVVAVSVLGGFTSAGGPLATTLIGTFLRIPAAYG